ncbi:hypothetical protein SUGI_0471830 [Cryptomeria japonica]|nr:hypothetical protein SUGI_0471830 [Cryptomeria japonica]
MPINLSNARQSLVTSGAKFLIQFQSSWFHHHQQQTLHYFHRHGLKALRVGVQKSSKATGGKRTKNSKSILRAGEYAHLIWWREKMQLCKKPSTKQLVQRLVYSNLLGLDENLKNGSMKDGSLNSELIQFKLKFPREVLLCRVGEFYEAVGFDACILVEYAGLNPMGGIRSNTVPRAGCPVMNLRQTLDELARNGFSVCVVEEVQGPSQARTRKERFISGHSRPGSPYVYGLAGADIDVEFPEPVPVVGISHSARGYCFISVLETMHTFSAEDGLTEEAVVAKLRAQPCDLLFLHSSLRKKSSGTSRWGAFGEGGLLWGECSLKHYEWFDGDPISQLLSKVRELYGLDSEESFRNVTIPYEDRPRPLYLGTATHIGVIASEGVPSLLKVLLPPDCAGLCTMYLKKLLLNPPPHHIALSIQAACKLMCNVTCAIPAFVCVPAPKIVKLIGAKEANHIEFCRIRNMAMEILYMHEKPELRVITNKLIDPTWMETGLKIDIETLVTECREIVDAIGKVIFLEGESEQEIYSSPIIPDDFFIEMESSWKGRIKRVNAEDVFVEVERAAEALSLAVEEDFLPIVLRVKAVVSPLGSGAKGEICYSKDHESIWFKGKCFAPAVWANTPGEEQIQNLIPAKDAKGKKVGTEWYTTPKVEEALDSYREAVVQANLKVTEILRSLAEELQRKTNTIVFLSVLSVITKTLFAHVSEGRRRDWIFPMLKEINQNPNSLETSGEVINQLEVVGLVPYWFDLVQGAAVPNTIQMQSLFLLTGPNGGGKSSVLRSICAMTLLGICGLMVPTEKATIPHFDSIMLHMMSYDSPADGKSSFQMEMSEMRSILSEATNKSLVLVDEICRGTEVQKGTCIAASMIEKLDSIGCIGVISTHLHGLLDLPLKAKNIMYKAMGTDTINGRIKPTWKLIDGVCRESLAFETALNEGIPENVVRRAAELYASLKQDEIHKVGNENGGPRISIGSSKNISYLCKDKKTNHKQITMTEKQNISNSSLANLSEIEQSIALDDEICDRACSYYTTIPNYNGRDQKPETITNLQVKGSESAAVQSMPMSSMNTLNSKFSQLPLNKSRESRSDRNVRLLKEAENAFISTCQKKLRELDGRELLLTKSSNICCSSIGACEQPPPTMVKTSCVYILQRPDGKFYVGQTDDLAGRIGTHRSVEGWQNVPFIYVKVPGKSVGRELETLLINRLPLLGIELVNKADQNHRNFGTSATLDIPPF